MSLSDFVNALFIIWFAPYCSFWREKVLIGAVVRDRNNMSSDQYAAQCAPLEV